jgi:hypothetical protein
MHDSEGNPHSPPSLTEEEEDESDGFDHDGETTAGTMLAARQHTAAL